MKYVTILTLILCSMAGAQPVCTANSLVGTYVVSYFGWLTIAMPNAAPITGSGMIFGIISIGYDGKMTGAAAISGSGPVTDYDVTGTIQVNADCTGSLRLTGKARGTNQQPMPNELDRFVFLPETGEARAIISDMGPGLYPALMGTWKRISSMPNAAKW